MAASRVLLFLLSAVILVSWVQKISGADSNFLLDMLDDSQKEYRRETGPNKKIEALLREVRDELGEIREEIKSLKGNKTTEKDVQQTIASIDRSLDMLGDAEMSSLSKSSGLKISPALTSQTLFPSGEEDSEQLLNLSLNLVCTGAKDHIPKDTSSLKYVRVDDAIAIMRLLGPGTFMAKAPHAPCQSTLMIETSWVFTGSHSTMQTFISHLGFAMHLTFQPNFRCFRVDPENNYFVRQVIHILDDFL
ncbi:hypothetical protein ACROYT_G012603 [Oculina patagonica]